VAEGEVAGLVLSFVDISDRIRADHATREADRQRVMLESFGAACHHLGQPATVLLANLEMMQEAALGGSEGQAMKEMLGLSMEAIRRIGAVLHQLNTVDEYRTTEYAGSIDTVSGHSRIIQIAEGPAVRP